MVVHLSPLLRLGGAEADQRAAIRRAFAVIAEYLSACRSEEGYCITFVDQEHLECFLRAHGEERPFLRELAEAGRLDAFAAYHALAQPAAHGEALLRNLVSGVQVHSRAVGLKPVVCLTPEAVRQCLQLPQLLVKIGVEVIVQTDGRSEAARGRIPAFGYVMAPDGSLLMLKAQEGAGWPGDLNELMATAAESFSRQAQAGLNCDLLLLDGSAGSPPEWMLGRAEELAQLTPSLVLSTPKRYLAAVKPEAHLRRASLPLLGEELGGPAALTAGVWKLMQTGRLAENAILSAERLATITHLAGARYPQAALDKAWRQTLYAQGHTQQTGGTWCFDLLACYREAVELAGEVGNRSLSYLSGRVDTRRPRGAPREGTAVIVFNTAGWQRSDVCEASVALEGPLASGFELVDDRGRKTPVECLSEPSPGEGAEAPRASLRFVAADVPALGYRTWYLRPARALPPVVAGSAADSAEVENEFLSVSADAAAGIGITSLRSKASGGELVDRARGLGAEVAALSPSGELTPLAERSERLKVWKGPVSSQLELEWTSPGGERVTQRVRLYQGLPRVGVCTSISAAGASARAWALRFPPTVPAAVAACGEPFGAVMRGDHNARLDIGGAEGTARPGCWLARDWVDLGAAPSLLVMSGTEAKRALPLARCAIITSGDLKQRAVVRALEHALLREGIACASHVDKDDLEADSGVCSLRISLGRENAHSKRLLQSHPEAAARLSKAMVEREWAAVLVPGGEPEQASAPVPTLIADSSVPRGVLALIEMLAEAVTSGGLAIPEECDFLQSGRPPSGHGMALIDSGPMAVGVDAAGRLWSLLDISDGEGGRQPRTPACHQLAIVPHAGDWREGEVSRTAYGITNPLIAVQTPLQGGDLPPQFSLCSVDRSNLIITACRPAESDPEQKAQDTRDVIIRMYEPHGKPVSARLDFGASPQEAWLSDPLEKRGEALAIAAPRRGLLRGGAETSAVSLELGANEVLTLGVRLPPLAAGRADDPDLGPTREPSEVLFSRYWDHNAGAAPIGGQPLSLWMRGELPIGKNTRFSLGLSNDSGPEISGNVQVIGPAEWTLIPRQVPYRIAPGSEAVYEIMIVVPPEASPCFLRATTHVGCGPTGPQPSCEVQTLQEVLPIGEIRPLSVSLSRQADAFLVAVENPNADYVEGQVTLVTPVESWGQAVGSLAVCEVSPRLHSFRVEGNASQTLRFAVGGEGEVGWAVARVAWYGNVQYADWSS